MNLEEAIKTALSYEARVHKTYMEAMETATSDLAKKVFKTLRDEEKYHLDYLHERLDEWKKTGTIKVASLATAIPSREIIDQSASSLREKVAPGGPVKHGAELEMLRKALKVEVETGDFYKEMVRTLDAEGRRLFERFVEIEEGHQAIVQAEIDSLSGSGYWFDTPDFKM